MSYKDNIYNLTQEHQFITFLFRGTDQTAAHLRQFIKNKVHSYCIHEVIFLTKNSKDFTEEHLTLRLNLLVPDNATCDETTMGTINVKGPYMVTTNDINNLKIVQHMPLCYLKESEELYCHLKVKKGCGDDHQKWNPVSGITFKEISYGVYQFSFELIGLITIDEMMMQIP